MNTFTLELSDAATDAVCSALGISGTSAQRRSKVQTYLAGVVAAEIKRLRRAHAVALAESAFEQAYEPI